MNDRGWTELARDLEQAIQIDAGGVVQITDLPRLKGRLIDDLVHRAAFAPDPAEQARARRLIWALAESSGIFPASIQELYQAMGKGRYRLHRPGHEYPGPDL